MQDNEKILYETIGQIIRKLRTEKGIKFTIFCYENDIPKSTLYDIEHGIIKAQFSSIYKILNALDMDITDFVKQMKKELPKNFSLLKY